MMRSVSMKRKRRPAHPYPPAVRRSCAGTTLARSGRRSFATNAAPNHNCCWCRQHAWCGAVRSSLILSCLVYSSVVYRQRRFKQSRRNAASTYRIEERATTARRIADQDAKQTKASGGRKTGLHYCNFHLGLAGFGRGRSLDQNDVGQIGGEPLQQRLVEVLPPDSRHEEVKRLSVKERTDSSLTPSTW